MKFFALAIAAVAAQEEGKVADDSTPKIGVGCKSDPTVCDATGETCIQSEDSVGYPRFTCQDCTGSGRTYADEENIVVSYLCPGEEAAGASSLYASAAALAAAVVMMY